MSLPAGLTLVPLHGRILKANSAGTPATGSVSFRIEQTLRDNADHVLLGPTTLTATLDTTGAFTINLPATDDPDVTPSGWTYVVTIATDALRDTWRIEVPAATAGTLELADIAPAVAPSTLVTYVLASTVGQTGGPAGPLDDDGLIPADQIPGGTGGGGGGVQLGGDLAGTNSSPQVTGTHLAGPLPLAQGGTGATSASAARTSLGLGAAAVLAVGTTTGTVAAGDDTRLTDSRTPTAHATSHASGGTDPVTPAAIGAATTSALSAHTSATTTVHGITDTSALETTTGSTAKVTAHTAATDPHGDRAAATSAISTHAAAADPHGDRAAASTALTTHAGAADPHGDRAYTDTAVATKPGLASTTPSASAVGDAGATGAGTTAARADHTHPREGFGSVTAQTTPGASSANGTASTVARSDHTHGTPSLTSSAATTSAVGDTATVGTATTPARGDHVHGRESFGAVTTQTSYGLASANGNATTPARSDHAHGTPAQDPLILLRNAMTPAGRIETRSRLDSGITSSTVTSGTLYLIPIWLPTGTVVSSISFVAGNTGFSSPTNQWFTLHDNSRVQLAVTTNDGTTAWAAQAAKTLTIATTAAGAASSFTTTYSGVHYLGFMVTATTMSNMMGGGAGGAATENTAPAFGACNTSLTTPQAFPFTATAPSAAGPLFYAYIS